MSLLDLLELEQELLPDVEIDEQLELEPLVEMELVEMELAELALLLEDVLTDWLERERLDGLLEQLLDCSPRPCGMSVMPKSSGSDQARVNSVRPEGMTCLAVSGRLSRGC